MRWSNWSKTCSCVPKQYLEPSSLSEIQETLLTLKQSSLSLKVAGFGHSVMPIACSDDILISLRKMSGLKDYDEQSHVVTFWAGTSLKEVVKILRDKKRAITNIPVIGDVTLAGLIATGSHGTGLGLRSLMESLTSMELMTSDGTVHTFTGEQLNAARVHLGVLGIVVSISFQTLPEFGVLVTTERMPWKKLMADLEGLLPENPNLQFYYLPHTEEGMVTNFQETDHPWISLPDTVAAVPFLAKCRYELAERINGLAPYFNRRQVKTFPQEEQILRWDQAYIFQKELPLLFGCEYAISLEDSPSALSEMKQFADQQKYTSSMVWHIRFGSAEQGWLSPAYARDSAYISVYVYYKSTRLDYLKNMERILCRYQGRPHWGKWSDQTKEYFQSVFPKWSDFCSFRRELDPEGRFLNPMTKKIFIR